MRETNKRSCVVEPREPRRNRWHRAGRRALSGLLIISLALTVGMLTSPQARAASRYPTQVRLSSMTASGSPCSDPKKISLDCLGLPPNSLTPANTVQNPLGNGSALFFFTDPSVTYQQPLVFKLWSIMLGAADVCAVIMLMLRGLQIMVAGTVFRYARALETIPEALLGLIAAHVSLIFIIFIIGLNNALSVDFYNWANINVPISLKSGIMETITTIPANVSPADCPSNFFSPPACAQTVQVDVLQITPQSLDFTDAFQNGTSLFNILSLIVEIMELMLLAQVIIRVFFIDIYIMLASALMFKPLRRLWLRGFLSTVLVQFVQVAALVVAELIMPAFFQLLHSQLPDQVIAGDALGNLCKIGALWFIFRIPALLDEAPMQSMMAAGQAMSAAVGMTIGTQIAIAQTVATGVLGLGSLTLGRQKSGGERDGNGPNGNQGGKKQPASGEPAHTPTSTRTRPEGRKPVSPRSGVAPTEQTGNQASTGVQTANGQATSAPGPGAAPTNQGMNPLSGTPPTGQAVGQTPASEQVVNGQATATGATGNGDLLSGGGVAPDGNVADGNREGFVNWRNVGKEMGIGHDGETDLGS